MMDPGQSSKQDTSCNGARAHYAAWLLLLIRHTFRVPVVLVAQLTHIKYVVIVKMLENQRREGFYNGPTVG
jgi:hypothetical protein